MSTSTVVPLHFDCVICQASSNELNGEDATTVLLVMMLSGDCGVEEICQGLCLLHVKRVQRAAREAGVSEA